ncbi:MAG: hypothetical protein WBB01_19425 [Phormidesmis sp.]
MPPIFFFIPSSLWPDHLPNSPDQNWAGYGLGLYTWTIQTCLRLRAAGIPCQLTQQLPDEGIVLCHSNAFRAAEITPAPKRLLVCLKAEAPFSAIAPLHIVQNPAEASVPAKRFFIPHWPQPQLMPRETSRGDRFETLAFFGHQASLAPELQSDRWQSALAERGLRAKVIANTNAWSQYSGLDTGWNDYRDVDAVVAVRSFNRWQRRLTSGFAYKPATKLYNAWLSGTIPILGAESAYRQTGQRGQDYVEMQSFQDLLNSLELLKAKVSWRRSLLAQGQIRAQDFTAESIVRQWQIFLERWAIPAYAEWCRYASWQQTAMLMALRSASYVDRGNRRGRRLLLAALADQNSP